MTNEELKALLIFGAIAVSAIVIAAAAIAFNMKKAAKLFRDEDEEENEDK